ncbi:non-homologous end-joining DNA ligase [Gordonia sp. (in: high G+C Gram-positive bacteria)]|uniref:non-homologous end-joining DNA ligase n=1 Tax=Gordonia sp. (in: high G+C Gram-positive bacteria) TaxID=84139 RepID=UPI003C720808
MGDGTKGDGSVVVQVPGPGGILRDVRISSPDRIYFAEAGHTKLDLVNYYLSVADGITRALFERPCMLHRFPRGTAEKKVHQKKLPAGAPDWIQTVDIFFPRYERTVSELCVTEPAAVLWAVQMATVEFHPWNSRRTHVEHPDEWRIDLDPMPDADFARVRRVAGVVHEVLDELGIVGYPKTSGGHGLHIYVRIEPEWEFADVRRAALAFGTEIVRRLPHNATVTWWRKDRDPAAVFIDFNQNARDHTMAAAYSIRANARATVSAPLCWDEIDVAEPDDFTVATMPARYAELGDLHAGINDTAYRLDTLLEWAQRDGADGKNTDRAKSD